MAAETPKRPMSSEERAYLWVRGVFTLGAILLIANQGSPLRLHMDYTEFAIATSILVLAGAVVWVAVSLRRDLSRTIIAVLPLDLVALALFTSSLGVVFDPFYQVALAMPVLYALLVSRRQANLVAGGCTVAYAVGALVNTGWPPPMLPVFLFKLFAIPLITWLVAEFMSQQRRHAEELLSARDEKVVLNDELHRRLGDLQAVSEITEVIHSTLDFDRVGPIVLEIVAKVLDVGACALFVIDKDKGETLFSASYGMETLERGIEITPLGMSPLADDGHFTCITVFDHPSASVLFCADAEQIEALGDDDHLVLGAVASELVVAVENSRLYKLTRRLAITDELTGLHNYRYLQQRLEEEVDRAKRYNKYLSLLMLDTDSFKGFNDANGHIAGDVALAELGHVIRSNVRDVDIVCRYGGEEFAVLLPETDSAGAYVAAEKIREAVASHLFPDADGVPRCTITLSLGLATYPTHAEDRDSLLRESDDALYRAKNAGKNRVRTPVRGAEKVAAHVGPIPADHPDQEA